ncbi:MAG TPA: MFS transporter [bacterium]|nr:MFS transporter [bacterium]
MNRRPAAAVLALLAATQLIGVMDFSIVIVAIPSIAHEFRLTADQVQWVRSAYALMEAGFLLLGGRVCDAFDTKRVYMGALAVFGIASMAGGLAPNATLVFVARAVQGLAGAILAPGSLVLVTREFEPGDARNRALGVFGSVAMLGLLLGAIFGGVITGFLGWRWVFFVNVPVIAVMLAGSAVLLQQRDRGQVRPRLDIRGAVVGTAAILALIVGISTSSGGALRLVAFTGLAAALLAGFVWIEHVVPDPLVPFTVFRSRQFTGAIVVSGLLQVAAGIVPFTVTLVLQGPLGLQPQAAGLALVPAGLSGIAGGLLVGLAIRRIGLRRTVVVSLALLAGSTAPLVGPGLHGSAAWLALGFAVGALGFIGCSVATTIAATSSVAQKRMGLAGGLLNTFGALGGAIGAVVAGVLDAPGTVTAYATSFVVAPFLFVLAGVVLLVAYRPTTREIEKPSAPVGEAV